MATVGGGPVSRLASQPPRPRVSLGRTERRGLLSVKLPGPEQEDTRWGERQAGPRPPLPDSPPCAISQQRKLRLRDSLLWGHQGCGAGRGTHVAGSSYVPPAQGGRQHCPCRLLSAHGSSCVPPAQGGGSVVPAGCFLPTASGLTSTESGPVVPEWPSLPDRGPRLWEPVGWGSAWLSRTLGSGVPRAVLGPPRSSGLPC